MLLPVFIVRVVVTIDQREALCVTSWTYRQGGSDHRPARGAVHVLQDVFIARPGGGDHRPARGAVHVLLPVFIARVVATIDQREALCEAACQCQAELLLLANMLNMLHVRIHIEQQINILL